MTDPHWPPGSQLARLPTESRDELLATLRARGSPRIFASGARLPYAAGDGEAAVMVRGFARVSDDDPVRALLAIRIAGDVVVAPRTTACGVVEAWVLGGAVLDGLALDGMGPDGTVRHSGTRPSADSGLHWEAPRRVGYAAFPVAVRLARVLVELAHRCGVPDGAGTTLLPSLTQRELAAILDITEPTAQRALRELREAGIILTKYRRLTVLDPKRLREAAELA